MNAIDIINNDGDGISASAGVPYFIVRSCVYAIGITAKNGLADQTGRSMHSQPPFLAPADRIPVFLITFNI